jgi:hypothetical protein
LSELGVKTELIRLIQRHSDVVTTQRHYIKPSKDEVKKAMGEFGVSWAAKRQESAEMAKQAATVN